LAPGIPNSCEVTANDIVKVIRDGVGARSVRVENIHQVRYIEIFLTFRDPKTGSLVAACYNPLFTSRTTTPNDTAPQERIEELDYAKLNTDYGILGASLNGPKLWLPDWAEVEVGAVRDFNGIKAPWVGQLNVRSLGEGTPYQPMTVARKQKIGWNAGTTVLLLDDAEGHTWVMKALELGIGTKYTYEEFVAAGQGNFKELPPGWKFRVRKLTQDLIEAPESGVATVVADEFFNVYDKTGPGMTNYQP